MPNHKSSKLWSKTIYEVTKLKYFVVGIQVYKSFGK